jgi:hypothetical protein
MVLLLGYATQGAALDRGKLVVVQQRWSRRIVWALPLGYWLSNQPDPAPAVAIRRKHKRSRDGRPTPYSLSST